MWVKVQAVVFLAPLEFREAPTLLPPGVTTMATVPPLRCCARSKAAPSPHNCAPPLGHGRPCCSVELHHRASGLVQVLNLGWGTCRHGHR